MWFSPIHIYVVVVAASALIAAAVQDWALLLTFSPNVLAGLVLLIVFGILSEATAVGSSKVQGASHSSITWLPLIACVILFGAAAAVLLYAASAVVAEVVVRRKQAIRAVFNVSQFVLATALAAAGFAAAGGRPLALAADQGSLLSFDPQLIPFAVFAVTFLLLNHVLVTGAIALNEARPLRRVLPAVLLRAWGGSPLFDLLISPVALLVAFLYVELGSLGFLVSLLPLVFVRYSYLSKHKLEESNRDLLKVLVKAIETRDPYTSGHSMRVMGLAETIAEELSLNDREVERVKTAALLHDVGKIEVMYDEILKKPGSLSHDERRIIESHVHRGVEILTSLSSFDAGVVAAVRHHHESIDGSGYPDRLRGSEIPMAARIIKICDAIDAMLSDRPYRTALPVSEARRQLQIHAGTQFDPDIVRAVLDGSLVERHAEYMAAAERLEESGTSTPEMSNLESRL